MFMVMEFLDTAEADVVRIRKGRKNIQRGITAMVLLIFVTMFFIIVGTLVISFLFLLLFTILFVGMFVLIVGLIVKREIFSMMIYLKEK